MRLEAQAGFSTAVMLVPQAMAYALLAGLEPIVGLYASTLPLLLYAAIGRGPQLAVGPVALDSILVGGALVAVGATAEQAPTFAAVLALLTGGLLTLMGILRLGWLANVLTRPVIAGFMTAAAFIIGASQLPHVLGLDLPRSNSVLQTAAAILSGIPDARGTPMVVGGMTIASLVLMKRHLPNVPRFLVVVAGCILTTWMFELPLSVVGAVPAGLPSLTLPVVDLPTVLTLLPTATMLVLVAMMETLSVSAHFAEENGTEVNPNRELLGIGIANLGAGIVGGYSVASGLSRSAVLGAAGAKTMWAGVFTAIGVGLALIGATSTFAYLPKATLAGIIISALGGFVKSDVAVELWTNHRPSWASMAITTGATLGFGVVWGMGIGIGASIVIERLYPASAKANQ